MYPSSVNRGYRSGAALTAINLKLSRYPSSVNRGYRSGFAMPHSTPVISWYPSSVNRGYRSGIEQYDWYKIDSSVSILCQSRLSFWQDARYGRVGVFDCIHPLSIEAIVLALISDRQS